MKHMIYYTFVHIVLAYKKSKTETFRKGAKGSKAGKGAKGSKDGKGPLKELTYEEKLEMKAGAIGFYSDGTRIGEEPEPEKKDEDAETVENQIKFISQHRVEREAAQNKNLDEDDLIFLRKLNEDLKKKKYKNFEIIYSVGGGAWYRDEGGKLVRAPEEFDLPETDLNDQKNRHWHWKGYWTRVVTFSPMSKFYEGDNPNKFQESVYNFGLETPKYVTNLIRSGKTSDFVLVAPPRRISTGKEALITSLGYKSSEDFLFGPQSIQNEFSFNNSSSSYNFEPEIYTSTVPNAKNYRKESHSWESYNSFSGGTPFVDKNTNGSLESRTTIDEGEDGSNQAHENSIESENKISNSGESQNTFSEDTEMSDASWNRNDSQLFEEENQSNQNDQFLGFSGEKTTEDKFERVIPDDGFDQIELQEDEIEEAGFSESLEEEFQAEESEDVETDVAQEDFTEENVAQEDFAEENVAQEEEHNVQDQGIYEEEPQKEHGEAVHDHEAGEEDSSCCKHEFAEDGEHIHEAGEEDSSCCKHEFAEEKIEKGNYTESFSPRSNYNDSYNSNQNYENSSFGNNYWGSNDTYGGYGGEQNGGYNNSYGGYNGDYGGSYSGFDNFYGGSNDNYGGSNSGFDNSFGGSSTGYTDSFNSGSDNSFGGSSTGYTDSFNSGSDNSFGGSWGGASYGSSDSFTSNSSSSNGSGSSSGGASYGSSDSFTSNSSSFNGSGSSSGSEKAESHNPSSKKCIRCGLKLV